MTFSMPNSTQLDTYAGYIVWANNTVEGLLSYGILLIVLSLVVLGTRRYGASATHALLVGMLATSMIAMALTVMGALSQTVLYVLLSLTIFMYFYSYHN